jgi:N6-adenosine-specific RNA methylase IME4
MFMPPKRARRPEEAPHVGIVGGSTDNKNVADAASTINIPVASEERVVEPGGGPAPIKIDDSIRGLIPPLHAEERAQLEANLLKDGCLDPLIVDAKSGVLLDGHNRYEICLAREISYTVKRIKCADRIATELWVLEHQVGRRNLSDDQRAIIAAKIHDRRSGEARSTRASAAGKASAAKRKGNSETTSVSKLNRKSARTRATVAKEYNLSERKVGDAIKIVRDDPAAADKILAGEARISDVRRDARRGECSAEHLAEHEAVLSTLDGKVPSVIVADPPWNRSSLESNKAKPAVPYTERLCAICPPAADDAVLFLWAPPSVLVEALHVMSEWGFEYRTHAVWIIKVHFGGGFWFRDNHELVLMGTKGQLAAQEHSQPFPSIIETRTRSTKPSVLHRHIRESWPDAVRLELFGQRKRKGWLVHKEGA